MGVDTLYQPISYQRCVGIVFSDSLFIYLPAAVRKRSECWGIYFPPYAAPETTAHKMEIWPDYKSSCAAEVSAQDWATTIQCEDNSVLLFVGKP